MLRLDLGALAEGAFRAVSPHSDGSAFPLTCTCRVDHELDTQNFEAFNEDASMARKAPPTSRVRPVVDHNFIGYTYKNR